MWIGLTLSYVFPQVPPTFAIIAVATSTHGACLAWRGVVSRPTVRRSGSMLEVQREHA